MPSDKTDVAIAPIHPGEIFAGKSLFLLGGTGFLGKVCLSMLLDRYPEIRRVYLMVRASSEEDSKSRFWDLLVPSPAFDPLRRRHRDGLERFLEEKIQVVGGDITSAHLGLGEERAGDIAKDIDLLINCSGRVTFNPPLEAALKTNVSGTLNTIEFVRKMKRPALIHVSTCFVAGNRSGEIWENESLLGYYPRREEAEHQSEFRVDKEIDDCERLAARVKDEANDKSLADRFRELAKRRFLEEGRDPDDDKALRLAVLREKKNWIRARLTDLGIDKSKDWGWPNIYTYTKSLGEQVVAAQEDIVRAIVRPAIVESAIQFPFPGWNEGFTTTAPLVRMAMKGQNLFPVKTDVILDVIPVDMVAAATLAVSAQAMVEEPELVYQVASGDTNPSRLGRLVDLLGLYKRKHFREKETGGRVVNELLARMEAQAISPKAFEKYSSPVIKRATDGLRDALDKVRPRQLGPLAPILDEAKETLDRVRRFVAESDEHYQTFRPFIVENKYIFRTDNLRSLFSRVPESERDSLGYAPQDIDWYDYWLNVHLPGLRKWVFPKLDEGDGPKPRRIYGYRHLVEMFDACTKNHEGRVAMRITRDDREERYTYGELRECTLRVAGFLASKEIGGGDRVALLSENSPEWGMTYFGIVRSGATAIPLEKEIRTSEIVRLLQLGEATALIVSDGLAEDHRELKKSLKKEGLSVSVFRFSEVFKLTSEKVETERIASLPRTISPATIASIIFTSGTTGNPKGVMLSHRNFTSLVAKLSGIYDLSHEDGFLSVLPLHHSFEFTTGFLLPLSRGCQIHYLAEVSADSLQGALETGRISCIVGVPALWDLLKRRILNKFAERSERLEDVATALIDANYLLRGETPLNAGPLVFLPVHMGFGGRIRYLISGGSSLSEATLKTFRGLGFNLYEGYGLTEASPVLTVTRPEDGVVAGCVGKPLPGIDIRIHEPDSKGVGEVIARGPSIMMGYYGNPKATSEALRDGWLHTGDLGRLDDEGSLFIVGRLKDVIVDANGKNVYPDELEEVYADDALIDEFAIVGLPDGRGEKVAAIVVPKGVAVAEPSEQPGVIEPALSRRISEHFQRVSAELPLYKRVKVVELRVEALPKTATRKIRRKELVDWLIERRRNQEQALKASGDEHEWLLDVIATVCEAPRTSVRLESRLDELGFDSLMYNELSAAIESRTGVAPAPNVLMNLVDIRELQDSLARHTHRSIDSSKTASERGGHVGEEHEIKIPAVVAEVGRAGLTSAQRWFYHRVLESEFQGEVNIPSHTHFIVVANHASHLDMGMVKMALGEQGQNLVALAAADYFFDNKVKRAFFENFTNLVPMERRGSLRKSLEWAFELLARGYNVLIFPEGTRSRSGEIQTFQRGLGHLALRAGVGVLPIHLSTYSALPPGTWYLQSREVSATVGPFLDADTLRRVSDGLPRAEAERAVSGLVQAVVESLRDGTSIRIDHEIERQRRASKKRRSDRVPVEAQASAPSSGPTKRG